MQDKVQKRNSIVFYAIIFLFLMIFFAKLHPFVPYDGDDLAYTFFTRGALPVWGYWNPSRVLPEILTPLIGFASIQIIYPFCHDISWSLAIVCAIELSLFILLYLLSFSKMLRTRCHLSRSIADMLTLLFLICHFLIFRTLRDDNVHLFYCHDIATLHNYLIPELGCSIFVLQWISGAEGFDHLFIKNHPIRQGLILLSAYLLVFSHLLSCYTLVLYTFLRLLFKWLKSRGNNPFRTTFQSEPWALLIFILFLISTLFEMNGGRSSNLQSEDTGSRFQPFRHAARLLLTRLTTLNSGFLILVIAVVFLFFFFLCREKAGLSRGEQSDSPAYLQQAGFYLLCSALSVLYVIPVCAVSASGYASRPDVLFGICFFALTALFLLIASIIHFRESISILLPVLCLVLAFTCGTRGHTYKEPNVLNLRPDTVVQLNNAIFDQILEADRNDDFGATIYVDSDTRFHFFAASAESFLLNNGMAHHELGLVVETDPLFYEHYGISK